MIKKINISKKYKLPNKVEFCQRCVISNQRPRIVIDSEGICSACRYFEYKNKIDWDKREKELLQLLDKHRSGNERYDCVVPSSGGKDSASNLAISSIQSSLHGSSCKPNSDNIL